MTGLELICLLGARRLCIYNRNRKMWFLMAEYKKNEKEQSLSVYDAVRYIKGICNWRNKFYEGQQEIKNKLWRQNWRFNICKL